MKYYNLVFAINKYTSHSTQATYLTLSETEITELINRIQIESTIPQNMFKGIAIFSFPFIGPVGTIYYNIIVIQTKGTPPHTSQ